MSDAGTRPEYGKNIGRLIRDYPDFVILGDPETGGHKARTRVGKGSGGATLRDLTLDGLAAQMDICRSRMDGV